MDVEPGRTLIVLPHDDECVELGMRNSEFGISLTHPVLWSLSTTVSTVDDCAAHVVDCRKRDARSAPFRFPHPP